MGKTLTTVQPPIPTWGLSFSWRRLKITNEEALGPSPVRGRERNEEWKCFGERERHESFLKTRDTGLSGMKNWSDWSLLTEKIVQIWTSSSL
jgi:hypothetical protein